MKLNFKHIFMTALLVSSVASCIDKPHNTTAIEWPFKTAGSVDDKESRIHCAATLVDHQGNNAIDQLIVRLQSQALVSDRYLEGLGWAFIAKARSSFDPGYYQLAEQTALCLKDRQPDNLGASLLQGHALHQQHQFADAETIARQLVQQRGNWSDHGLLGDLLIEQGALDEAAEVYQIMMDKKPGPEAYTRAAHLRWLKADIDGAVELMEMAIAGSNGKNPESAAWLRHRLARYEFSRGNLGIANKQAELALEIFPDHAPSLHLLGQIALTKSNSKQAVRLFTRAEQLNPTPEYTWALIEALQLAGYEKRAQVETDDLHVYGANEDRRTYALFLASASNEPTSLSQSLILAKNEMALRQDIFTQDTYAWALWRNGHRQTAYEVIHQALIHGTPDARLYLHAGIIAAGIGDVDNANSWLGKAKRLGHMLWPSERALLVNEFAAITSQSSPPA